MGSNINDFSLDSITELNTSINRILLATDGSSPAMLATQYAVALAKTLGASLKAIFVAASEDAINTEVILDRESFKETRPSAAGLEVVKLYAKKNNIDCITEVVRGSVATTIIEEAEKFSADIIIVGNTGRTGLKRLALGSVAEEVVKNSSIPVLVLKAN